MSPPRTSAFCRNGPSGKGIGSCSMSPISQLTMGPMGLHSLKSEDLSPLNSLKSSVILSEIVLLGGARAGMQKKELADIFELSAPDFTTAFDLNNDKRNRLMKMPLPLVLAREMALILCEQTGLAVGGPDAERHALADVLKACSEYVRLMQR